MLNCFIDRLIACLSGCLVVNLVFVGPEASSAPDVLLLEQGQRLGQHRVTVQRGGWVSVLQPILGRKRRRRGGRYVQRGGRVTVLQPTTVCQCDISIRWYVRGGVVC